ncbi:MAG TPA: NAD(P)H-dependent oxidoreductase subunit E [Thermodesulfovibrionales bacterium]|nr:NAD(P)H-dependent oxidoreductase subunit E [Thermodesulfovibrionales bacterium]
MIDTLETIVKKHREKDGNVISLMQDTQEVFGYIPREAVNYFSEELGIALSRFYGVVTFYSQFHLNPRGKNIISVCCGTACHVKGGSKIADRVLKDLGLAADGETTADKEFTFEVVRCVGACSIAPVVLVNDKAFAEMTPDGTAKLIKQLKKEESGAAK